ncbi:MAG: alpha/beta hydrolase [Desulfobacteraceae bacterium]|nr:MAG: alpha/beta hydrolase [Desulfobacteraceae bacterium]
MNNKISDTGCISKQINFLSGGFRLHGILHLPSEENPPLVIGSHGFESSGDSPKQIALAEKCNKAGIAFFRFDHRGCGYSKGNFQEVTNIKSRYEDLISAYNTMMEIKATSNHTGLFGSSFGGTVCLLAAEIIRPSSIVTFAAPVRSSAIAEAINKLDISEKTRSFFHRSNFQFDISDKLALTDHILVVHGDCDSIVPVSNALEIYRDVSEPKKLLIQQGGDHLMSNPVHQQVFMEEALIWFKSHLCN